MSYVILKQEYRELQQQNLHSVQEGNRIFRSEGDIIEDIVALSVPEWARLGKRAPIDFQTPGGRLVDVKAYRFPNTVFIEYIQNTDKNELSAHWVQSAPTFLWYVNTSKERWLESYMVNIEMLKEYVKDLPLKDGGYKAKGYVLHLPTLVKADIARKNFPHDLQEYFEKCLTSNTGCAILNT